MKTKLLVVFLLFGIISKAQVNHWETAVYENDMWRYVVPTAEPDTNWRKVSFNASSWLQGQGGFGFGDGDDSTVITTNVSVFHRISLTVADTSKIESAILNVDYDDGFVAYLNNVEIARVNMTPAGPPPYNTTASASHEAVMYNGGNPDYFNITETILHSMLRNGTNVLSIQTHNVTANSSDLSSRVWLSFGIRNSSVFFGNPPSWFNAPVDFTDSNLPIVIINTNNQTIVDEPKIMTDFGIIYNGIGIRNYMSDPMNNYNGKAGIEIRGSSSQSLSPKKSYGVELWDVNGNAIDSSLVGMPKQSDWILSANYADKSLLNNTMTYHTATEMGWYAARHQHVELVINGEYQGVYVLMEKIKRDNHRVDIAQLQLTDIFGDEVTGGYIIKVDKSTGNGGQGWTSTFAPDTADNGQTIYFQYDYPSDLNIMPQQAAYIQSYVDSFETALAGPNFMDTVLGYPHFIDVNSFVDYFLINELSKNVDGYRLSTYLHKDKNSNGGKMKIGPVWDYDIAWANAGYCAGADTSGWAYDFALVCPNDYWEIPFWWDRLLQDPAFRDKVKCRWDELKQTALSVNHLHAYCDSMAIYLNESQQRNFALWPILGTYVWPNPAPYPADYQGEIDELKNWITARWSWLDANMPGTLAGCNIASVPNENPNAQSILPYPNPFSNTISLSMYLPSPQTVKIELLNVLGQTVQPVQTEQHTGGTNVFTLTTDASLAPGIYLIRITAGTKTWTQQLSKTE